jgi:hypothetical protein
MLIQPTVGDDEDDHDVVGEIKVGQAQEGTTDGKPRQRHLTHAGELVYPQQFRIALGSLPQA